MFFITVLLSILGLIGADLFAPSLPAIAQVFHQTANHSQLTISLFLLGYAVSQLFYGPFSDRVGRKPPLYVGVLIFILGSIMCLWANSFFGLCLARILQGIGAGAGLSLARIILRDCYTGVQLAIRTSYIAIFVSLTPAIAPFVGGILQQKFGFHANFIFLLLYGLILLFLLTTLFKETNAHKEKTLTISTTVSRYRQLLKNGFFMRYAIIAGFTFAAIILNANILPFIIQQQLKLSAFANGVILLIGALGISIGSLISSRIVARINSKRLINLGLLSFTMSGFLLCFFYQLFGTTLICLIPLIFFICVACGLIFPNVVALSFSAIHSNFGIGGALYGAIQIFISMLMNLLLNIITSQNQAVLGLFYLMIGVCGLILIYFPRVLFLKSEINAR